MKYIIIICIVVFTTTTNTLAQESVNQQLIEINIKNSLKERKQYNRNFKKIYQSIVSLSIELEKKAIDSIRKIAPIPKEGSKAMRRICFRSLDTLHKLTQSLFKESIAIQRWSDTTSTRKDIISKVQNKFMEYAFKALLDFKKDLPKIMDKQCSEIFEKQIQKRLALDNLNAESSETAEYIYNTIPK